MFNVVFNNRDDHPKNFAYIMSPVGKWTLAPAYDVIFCEGSGGYHQMDVMGEALEISREALLRLGQREAALSADDVADSIGQICEVAGTFAATAQSMFPEQITPDALRMIQNRIDNNISRLR